jgi:glycosyltransferase involved in cell wall biosynthesis
LKLLALIERRDHVCYRYRLAAFQPALAQAGWRLECEPLAQGSVQRWRQFRRADSADVVVLQRRLLPLWQLLLLRKHAQTLVFDFDDAVFHRDSYHPRGTRSAQRMLQFWATMHAADVVLAGNRFLQQRAASFIDSERVHYFPTCVEPRKYQQAEHLGLSPLRLVWIGQRSTLPSLFQAAEALKAAAQACPGLSLRVVSDIFPNLPQVPIENCPWSGATEAADLAGAHLGVSWLPDDDWSRGKCGLKVLQYMAAGLPVIGNRVGVHLEMIVEGVTGFLADTPGEWAVAVRRLAADPALRSSMGLAARRHVERHYAVAAWQPALVDVLERFAPRAGGQRSSQPRGMAPRRPACAGRP